MPLIKVTGYIDTADLNAEEQVDLAHESGLSEQGYVDFLNSLASLALIDVEFELQAGQ